MFFHFLAFSKNNLHFPIVEIGPFSVGADSKFVFSAPKHKYTVESHTWTHQQTTKEEFEDSYIIKK